jgi:cholesterol transport system auxiliary component
MNHPPLKTLRRRGPVLALALAGALILGGCAGGLLPKPAPAPTRHTLDAAAPPAAAVRPNPGAAVLVVGLPRAAPGHDSQRMVYLRHPLQLEAFAYHEWVDTPARMLLPLMVRALQGSPAFAAVLAAPSAASGTLRLETELIRLQQDFGQSPSQVRLTLRAVLLDSASRRVIAVRELDIQQPAPSEDPVGGVAAAHAATEQLLKDLTAFCAGHAGG